MIIEIYHFLLLKSHFDHLNHLNDVFDQNFLIYEKNDKVKTKDF